jgi:hypothetical protein
MPPPSFYPLERIHYVFTSGPPYHAVYCTACEHYTVFRVQYLHEKTNLILARGIDDVWVNPEGELLIVDYKTTSKNGEITLDANWQIGYKRQIEIYQWLFRMNGLKVFKIGYYVYCNGDKDKEAFNGKLEFDIKVIPYEGDDRWVEEALVAVRKCLMSVKTPEYSTE